MRPKLDPNSVTWGVTPVSLSFPTCQMGAMMMAALSVHPHHSLCAVPGMLSVLDKPPVLFCCAVTVLVMMTTIVINNLRKLILRPSLLPLPEAQSLSFGPWGP